MKNIVKGLLPAEIFLCRQPAGMNGSMKDGFMKEDTECSMIF